MMNYTRKEFIDLIAPMAMDDMRKTGVPASLTIAQAILESNDGNSTLARLANNLFGMKGKGPLGSVILVTREYENGLWRTVQAKFRKYRDWSESIADHSQLFINGVSWNRNLYRGVIGNDGISACYEVARAGYATDPDYAQKLIRLIQAHNLLQYDHMVKEESEVMKELLEMVEQLKKRVENLEERVKEVPAPEWFVKEFPNALDLLHQKTGTPDFWRSFAVALRALKNSGFRVSESD